MRLRLVVLVSRIRGRRLNERMSVLVLRRSCGCSGLSIVRWLVCGLMVIIGIRSRLVALGSLVRLLRVLSCRCVVLVLSLLMRRLVV